MASLRRPSVVQYLEQPMAAECQFKIGFRTAYCQPRALGDRSHREEPVRILENLPQAGVDDCQHPAISDNHTKRPTPCIYPRQNCVEKARPSGWGTLGEAPKHALGAFLPDLCPCGLAALATQPFHPEANRYMCRSYHTGRDHPACDAVLRHAPMASLDGTLHRHLHALEQSPAYLCFSADQNGRGLARATSPSLN
jgi:hypothetical protein